MISPNDNMIGLVCPRCHRVVYATVVVNAPYPKDDTRGVTFISGDTGSFQFRCNRCRELMISVDGGMANPINVLNKLGLITMNSCEGYVVEPGVISMPYIQFAPTLDGAEFVPFYRLLRSIICSKNQQDRFQLLFNRWKWVEHNEPNPLDGEYPELEIDYLNVIDPPEEELYDMLTMTKYLHRDQRLYKCNRSMCGLVMTFETRDTDTGPDHIDDQTWLHYYQDPFFEILDELIRSLPVLST